MLNRQTIVLTIIAITAIMWANPIKAETPTMRVSELEPGMRGIGRTVVQGTEIEEFDVEIIGIFTDMGYDGGPLILVRISGDVVDRTGGIAGGYSGSPVFIDGKLIGAISWGPSWAEADVCGATPIHDMLRAFSYEKVTGTQTSRLPHPLDAPITVAGRTFDSVLPAGNGEDPHELEHTWGDTTLVLTPCRTPLMVSGLSDRGFERLTEFATERLPYLDIVRGPGGGSTIDVTVSENPPVLEPGASVGVQLASGDLDITAVGTLTWVDDAGRFLAFGHPMLADGPTNLPFVTSRIVYTMQSPARSYKLGEAMDVVGTVTQDRAATTAGNFGEDPEMDEFDLEVIDRDLNRTRHIQYSVINKEAWLPFLGWLVPMEGLFYASDRMGPGTCHVSFSIRGQGLERPIERENLVYASMDIGYESRMEFMEALSIVTFLNPYREVKLTKVDITVEVTSDRRTMDIVRARFQNPPNIGPGAIGYAGPPDEEESEIEDGIEGEEETESPDGIINEQDEAQDSLLDEAVTLQETDVLETIDLESTTTKLVGYHPGETVEVLVTFRPYRLGTVQKVIGLEIPDDFPSGQTSVEIFGGASLFSATSVYYGDSGAFWALDDLDMIIDGFMARDVSNSLVVRLKRIPTGDEDPYFYLQDEYMLPSEIRTTLVLDDVIYGYVVLPIEILAEEEEPEEEEETESPDLLTDYDSDEVHQEQPETPRSRNPFRH